MTNSEPPSRAARIAMAAGGLAWRYRREAGLVVFVGLTGGVPLAVPAGRRWARNSWRHARTRRLIRAGLRATRVTDPEGRLPKIDRIEAMPFGERVHLRALAGHWLDLIQVRAEPLAAAAKAASVRVEKDPNDASKITLDVVRRDPLAAIGDIPWEGLASDELSLWDDIHIGTTDAGVALYLSLVERGMIVGGLPGAGKSTFLRLIAAHAAKSRAHLLLIDPNKVQFAPWRDRALAYASSDPREAQAVLDVVLEEVDRRLDWLTTLPGAPEKVSREIADEYDVPLWLLMIDELAYHTSVAGTGESRAVFGRALRDIESRCRAAGIIVVVATQRPTDRVVPRELGDLFPVRVAFKVNAGNSDVILGDGWAKKGHNAAEIPLTARGQAYVLAEGESPIKFKSARIPQADAADLSVTTVPLKPRSVRVMSAVPDVA